MPSTPIIFGVTFIFEGKIVKHSANMALSLRNNPGKIIFGVGRNYALCIVIDLFGE